MKTIKENPGLNAMQLLNKMLIIYPNATIDKVKNSLKRRLAKYCEFMGSRNGGGYHLRKKMKLTELQEMTNIDIKENNLYRLDSRLLDILLADRTTKKNLIWATDNYASRGVGYQSGDQISVFRLSNVTEAL